MELLAHITLVGPTSNELPNNFYLILRATLKSPGVVEDELLVALEDELLFNLMNAALGAKWSLP
jgi:hypothetical protein